MKDGQLRQICQQIRRCGGPYPYLSAEGPPETFPLTRNVQRHDGPGRKVKSPVRLLNRPIRTGKCGQCTQPNFGAFITLNPKPLTPK